jgi:hypothetical protein
MWKLYGGGFLLECMMTCARRTREERPTGVGRSFCGRGYISADPQTFTTLRSPLDVALFWIALRERIKR